MPRKPTGKPNGRPLATDPAPTPGAERARQWRLKNKERSRAYAKMRLAIIKYESMPTVYKKNKT